MFYDNFTNDQICGIFSMTHFIVIAIFFVSLIIAVYYSLRMSQKQVKKSLLIIAIIITVLEIIKICIRIYKKDTLDSWIPFYFCSLFIYAIWFSFSKNEFIRNCGYSFMVFGGIFASISFIIYPSTSLMLYPVWHPGSLHSILYHWLLLYCGLMIVIKLYVPKASHFFNYLVLTSLSCVLAIFINHFLGTNMMFLSNPFGLGFLTNILEYSKILYIFLVYFAQCVILYWLSFGIYKLITIKRKNNGTI